MTLARANIAYIIHLVSPFMHAPEATHGPIVKHIFIYYIGTTNQGLLSTRPRNSFCKANAINLVVIYLKVRLVKFSQ